MTRRDPRPRRSVLYMPGANERALEKAKTLPADALILDLEDAVAPDAKAEARERVVRRRRRPASTATARSTIRVNGLGTAVARRRPPRPPPRPARPPWSSRRSTRPPTVHDVERALEAAGAPDHTADLGDGRDAGRDAARRAIAAARSG